MRYAKIAITLAGLLAAASPASARPCNIGNGFGTCALVGSLIGPPSRFGYGYGPYDYNGGRAYASLSRNERHCARRYRSYDPGTGTYLGRHGVRHFCR